LNGGLSPIATPEASQGEKLSKATEVNTAFQGDRQSLAVISGSMQRLVLVKSAAGLISGGGEGFYRSLIELERQIDEAAIC
jgi:hypothetical protein